MQITWNDADKVLRLIADNKDQCNAAQETRALGLRILDAFPGFDKIFPHLRGEFGG